jgi:anti-anti-sigma factor
MSFHFLSHSWEVKEVDDGLLVRCTHRDLDALTIPVMVDELYELVLENGPPNLYLDFGQLHYLASIVIGKLISLNEKLHHIGGRVVVCNLDPSLYEPFRVARVTELLDIRVNDLQEAGAV